MSSYDQEEWERDMMSGLHPMHPMLLDQAPDFPHYQQDQVDPLDEMDWWPRDDDFQMGFDPVGVAGPAEPAATPAYQLYHDPPLMQPTEDNIVARDYGMYDYGAGSEDGWREESGESRLPDRHPQGRRRTIYNPGLTTWSGSGLLI